MGSAGGQKEKNPPMAQLAFVITFRERDTQDRREIYTELVPFQLRWNELVQRGIYDPGYIGSGEVACLVSKGGGEQTILFSIV